MNCVWPWFSEAHLTSISLLKFSSSLSDVVYVYSQRRIGMLETVSWQNGWIASTTLPRLSSVIQKVSTFWGGGIYSVCNVWGKRGGDTHTHTHTHTQTHTHTHTQEGGEAQCFVIILVFFLAYICFGCSVCFCFC